MNFELHFPTGYQIENIYDGNIDLHVICSNNDVYFATVFTIQNIQNVMTRNAESFFWATDMVIVKDLMLKTIQKAIRELIEAGYLEAALTKIGTKETVYQGNI